MKKSTIAIGESGLRWLGLALLVLLIDLASKYWVMQNFTLYESRPLIPFFNLTYAQNPGAAFSFLADKAGWQRWFFSLIAIGIVVTLLVIMRRTPSKHRVVNVAYAMIIGGALGNLYDRMVHGVVIDFIDFHVGDWHYPIFNLADSAIFLGAILVILDGFIGKHADKPAAEERK